MKKLFFLILAMLNITISNSRARVASIDEVTQFYNQGIKLIDAGRPLEGIKFLKKALDISQKDLGKYDSNTAMILKHLGAGYLDSGDSNMAAYYYERALAIDEKELGYQDANTAKTLQNLGAAYGGEEDFPKAISFLEKALAIDEKILGTENADTALVLYNLGASYGDMGNDPKAIWYLEKALAIDEKLLGTQDPYTAMILQTLGASYRSMGNLSKALSCYEKALAIDEKVLGPQHSEVALILRNLGVCYAGMRDYVKAMSYLKKALKIEMEILSELHPNKAIVLGNMGDVYTSMGSYKEALSCFQKALFIEERVQGVNHPETAMLYQRMANLYYIQNDITQTQVYVEKALPSLKHQLLATLSMDEETRLSWEMSNMGFGVEPCVMRPEKIAEMIIQRKGVVLDSLLEDRALALVASHDDTGRKQLEEIRALRSQLTKIGFSNKKEDQDRIEQLHNLIGKLQRSLSIRSTSLGRTRNSAKISVNAAAKSLSKGEYLMDFIQFSDPKLKEGKRTCYGAMLLGQDGNPKFVRMDGAREIDGAIKSLHAALAAGNEKLLTEQQGVLTEKLWEPIAAQLPTDAKKLVIGPDGELSFLSFAALQAASGKFLSESYEFSYVGNGRDLTRPLKDERSKRISLFANPIFDRQAVKLSTNSLALRSAEVSEFGKIVLPQLPGTQAESDIVQKEAKDAGWTALCCSGADATKQHLLELKNPGILHLATHGFYLNSLTPDENDTRGMKIVGSSSDAPTHALMKGVDPMRASGVALTGAQATLKAWSEGKVPDPQDDGILTAEEVSGLSLDGTWLVTLSACESGVGEVKSGEGVFGLRRAFMMAGAQNLLMTLWPVNDDTTAKIMADFYKEALATHDAAGSLAKVQREWLVKLRKEKGLLAAVRDAGPFAMVVMANPNAKPMPESSPASSPQPIAETIPAKVSASESLAPVSTVPPDSSENGNIMEFSDALAKADAGDAKAQAVVSIYCALGYKTEKDLTKAAEYASKSAAQNCPLGQYQLGVLISGGEGVEKDPEKGKELKVQSIEGLNTMAEDPYALAALGAMALRGEGVVKDMKKAAKLYRKSADLGYAPAQLLYSMMLTKGVGVSTDASAARKYASMAEEQNYHP